jgi:hypothetical protein
MWLASADVTGERDDSRIGWGPTSVLRPHAEVAAQVPLMTTGMVVADIGLVREVGDQLCATSGPGRGVSA